MARPALSGTRTLQILDIMAAAPERAFSMSDLVRATASNSASCHAVLSAMVARGYLLRDEAAKTYRLGPALHAAGQAMAAHDPLLRPMQEAAAALAERTGLSIAISARAGDELVGVFRHSHARVLGQGLHVGQRVPFRPPVGATLAAWCDDAEIDRWLERGGLAPGSAAAGGLRADLAAMRARGYLATLATDSYAAISSAVTRRSEGATGRDPAAGLAQPATLDTDARFALAYIGAPVFDRGGRPLYSVVLSGFADPLDGRGIAEHGARLTRLCTDVMRVDRRA